MPAEIVHSVIFRMATCLPGTVQDLMGKAAHSSGVNQATILLALHQVHFADDDRIESMSQQLMVNKLTLGRIVMLGRRRGKRYIVLLTTMRGIFSVLSIIIGMISLRCTEVKS